MDLDTLTTAVDDAFVATSAGLSSWPPPRDLGDDPREEEYSRCLDPAKFRLIGARADAWVRALVGLGLAGATVADPDRSWRGRGFDGPRVTKVTTVTPVREGALRLHLARFGDADEPDGGVYAAVERPSLAVAQVPDCGCDACDCGSDAELLELDENITNVVTGGFVHVAGRRGWAMTNLDGMEATGEVPMEEWLAEAVAGGTPKGTVVTRGLAWWA